MSDRSVVIELMREVKYPSFPDLTADNIFGIQHPYHVFETVADHLLVNGIEVKRHGAWIGGRFHERFQNSYEEQCSCCKMWSLEYSKPYCPNCGAKMDL